MQLIEVPAKTGYVWFRQGIWLFRKNPLAFLTLCFAYTLVMTLIARVPYVGGLVFLILIPGVSVGFMAGCRDTIAGKPVFPTILVDGFRSHGNAAAKRLLLLGALFIAAMTAVATVATFVDSGMLAQQIASAEDVPVKGMLTFFAFSIPVAMLFWFAPILCAWHDMPVAKAFFASFVSCWRNRGAFIVYGVLWIVLLLAVVTILAILVQQLGTDESLTFAVMTTVSTIFTAMIYCSVYATYRGCFSVPAPDAPDLPSAPSA